MRITVRQIIMSIVVCLLIIITAGAAPVDSTPPETPVKLIFIHHSVGENWLADEDGGLGQELGENNYFVSDTYYSWGPDAIGDMTDIPDWIEWFVGPDSNTYMRAVYREYNDDAAGWDYYNRPMADPGSENEIIVFKSCFPNSNLAGNPDDPAGTEPAMTVSGAKYVYNSILDYFSTRPDKLFIAIAPPPDTDPAYGEQARAFSEWLVDDWLEGYEGHNLGVWDMHAVLSDPNNHHRITDSGDIEYINWFGSGTAAYQTGDAHPSTAGNRKATAEFVPVLNTYYNIWKEYSDFETDLPVDSADELYEPDLTDTTCDSDETDTDDECETDSTTADYRVENFQQEAGWVTYDDGESEISINCETGLPAVTESGVLCITASVVPGGWATTELLYDEMYDLSDYSGFSYLITSEYAGMPYSFVVYSYPESGDHKLYGYETTTPSESVDGWSEIVVCWDEFVPFDTEKELDASKIDGFFFSFDAEPGVTGSVCIDDLKLV